MRARLTIDVDYEAAGTSAGEARCHLNGIAEHLAAEGLFSRGSRVVVDSWTHKVEVVGDEEASPVGMTCCPSCGKDCVLVGEYPDTGTSMDFYEVRCPNGHRWEYEVENQTGEIVMRALEED